MRHEFAKCRIFGNKEGQYCLRGKLHIHTPANIRRGMPQQKRVFTAEQEEKLQAAMVQLEQQKAKRTKKTQQVENQLSLFDSVA